MRTRELEESRFGFSWRKCPSASGERGERWVDEGVYERECKKKRARSTYDVGSARAMMQEEAART
jgi:hypothetical protein